MEKRRRVGMLRKKKQMRAQRKENFFERVISFVSHDCVKICETNVFCLEKTQITCEKQERQRMFCWEEICWFALLQTHFVAWILNDWKGLPSEPKPTFLKERIFFHLGQPHGIFLSARKATKSMSFSDKNFLIWSQRLQSQQNLN